MHGKPRISVVRIPDGSVIIKYENASCMKDCRLYRIMNGNNGFKAWNLQNLVYGRFHGCQMDLSVKGFEFFCDNQKASEPGAADIFQGAQVNDKAFFTLESIHKLTVFSNSGADIASILPLILTTSALFSFPVLVISMRISWSLGSSTTYSRASSEGELWKGVSAGKIITDALIENMGFRSRNSPRR